MNYPAASSGVSLKALKRPKGRGIRPELRNKSGCGCASKVKAIWK